MSAPAEAPAAVPRARRRLAALTALTAFGLAAIVAVGAVLRSPLGELSLLVAGAVAAAGLWTVVTRSGAARWAGAVLALAALALGVVGLIAADGIDVLWLAVIVAAVVGGVLVGRWALRRDPEALRAEPTPGAPVSAARAGVLLVNPSSGDGKAERSDLVAQCRARGIEPVVLEEGDDLSTIANDALDRGADVIGMAGGDGSQALVASIAAERDVPMVVIPAGTRNHFALDLGLDRQDVVGSLDAFGEAVERTIDLAEVNGRVFVNNVSLGLYAEIISSPEYRDAKVDTALTALPQFLGPGGEPSELRFRTPDGREHDRATVIQVSNNPYGARMGARPRLDTGELGIYAILVTDAAEGRALVRALVTDDVERPDGVDVWTAVSFEVDADGPVPVGLDGESDELTPPLQFRTRPGALRIRRPLDAPGYSPAAIRLSPLELVRGLLAVARGRSVPLPD